MVKLLSKLDPDSIPETCRDYLKAENKNEVIYRTRNKETDNKINTLVSHAVDLYYASDKTEVLESEEYKMLKRFFVDKSKNIIISCPTVLQVKNPMIVIPVIKVT